MSAQSKAVSNKKRHSRGSNTVVETLREEILTLILQPGSAIDEVGLATRFGLSRTPIREALVILSREGLVTFLQNRTSIVTPHSMHNANDYMDTLSLLSRAVFMQAAERRQPSDLDEIAFKFEALELAVKSLDTDLIEPAALAFKCTICDSTRNFFYQKYYPSCLNYGRRTLRLHYYPVTTEQDLNKGLSEYRKLQEALLKQDPEQCDDIARTIISRTVSVLQRSLLPSAVANIDLNTKLETRLKGHDQ